MMGSALGVWMVPGFLAALVVLLVGVGWLALSQGWLDSGPSAGERSGLATLAQRESGGAPSPVVWARPPTATPWPTFTPAPRATATPSPVVAAATATQTLRLSTSTSTPASIAKGELAERESATVAALPTRSAETSTPELTEQVAATATVEPVEALRSSRELYRDGVLFHTFSFFPLQGTRYPDCIEEGRLGGQVDLIVQGRMVECLSQPFPRVPRSSYSLAFFVVFDTRQSPDDLRMEMRIRWLQGPLVGEDYVVMMDTAGLFLTRSAGYVVLEQRIEEVSKVFSRGSYVIELLDDLGEVVVFWEFEVY